MTTTNKSLAQPANNSPNWDVPLNDNFGVIDAALGSFTGINVTGIGTAPVVLTSTQYQKMGIGFTGALSNNVTYQIPSGVGGSWIISNGTSGAFSVTIASLGGGSTLAVAQGTRAFITSDGANVFYADDTRTVAAGSNGQVQYNSGGSLTGSANLTFDTNYLYAGGFYAAPAFTAYSIGYGDASASVSFYNSIGSAGVTDTVIINTGGSIRASFKNNGNIFLNGNVGIGTASPAASLEISGGSVLIGNSVGYYGKATGGTAYTIAYIDSSNHLVIGDPANATSILFYNNGANNVVIDTSGNLCVSSGDQSTSGISGAVAARGYFTRAGYSGAFDNSTFNIQNTGVALVAWVNNTNAGTIAYYSDYRLKSNIEALPGGALDRIMKMRPVSYTFASEEGRAREGFVAHELQQIVPSAVNGEKDGLTVDGDMQPQTIEWPPIVAVLTRAIQELKAEFDAYKAAHP